MAVRMSKIIFVSLLALLVLSSLVSSRGESYSGQPLFSQAVTVEIETAPEDVGHAAGPSASPHSLRSVAKRWTRTPTLLSAPLRSVMTVDADRLARACPSSPATAYQAAPLYQSLQVFRF
jgi:hypothetical protein